MYRKFTFQVYIKLWELVNVQIIFKTFEMCYGSLIVVWNKFKLKMIMMSPM